MTWMHEWPADYDPKLSMEQCLMKAAELLKECTGTMAVELMAVRLANVDTWTRIAQVHATNMQTEAIKRLDPAWRRNGG